MMDSKSLLIGITSFIAGGLLVSIAAVTFDKDESTVRRDEPTSMSMGMDMSTEKLRDKSGADFDEAFITEMIDHHEGAVEMAKLADSRAKHQEIKDLSKDIITAQEKEILQMKQWQASWNDTKGMMMDRN